MNASSTSNDQPDNESGPGKGQKSRLDRELAEILSKTGSSLPPEPIPITKYRQKPRSPKQPSSYDWRKQWRQVMDVLTAVPILTALAFGVLCTLVGDSSQLLAELFALAAVVVLLAPIVTRMRTGSGSSWPKIWRGQVMNSRPPQENPVDQIKRWFQSRPPRQ